MVFAKKLLIFLVIFGLGTGVGYYFSGKNSQSVVIEKKNSTQSTENKSINNKEKVQLKLALLKEYTDFVLMPKEEIGDLVKYVDGMGQKVNAINDETISAKFYATGETEDKEKKVLDFLDSLNKSIASDLQ